MCRMTGSPMRDRIGTHIYNEDTGKCRSMAVVMLFLRQTTGKTERYTHFCMPLNPVFTRDCGDGVHFMDEPFNGLDNHCVDEMRELFLELKKSGKIILIASHNSEDINILCDHVYSMESGNLEAVR